MQRHMQNISFLVIVSVLLGCAFFFSQLTNFDHDEPINTVIPDIGDDTGEVIPSCTGELSPSDLVACYSEADQKSEKLVDDAVDRILDMETDTNERISFMDIQLDWEESRDADCSYIHDRTEDPQQADINEFICLRDQNLERLSQLEAYYCDWYGEEGCETTLSQNN